MNKRPGLSPFNASRLPPFRALALGLILVLATSCVSTTRTRYEIAQSTDETARLAGEDREAVKNAIAEVAADLRLKDFTETSLVPETIAYYQQADTRNPLKIIAWADGDQIFVDLMQLPAQPGESLLYQRARDLLERELRSRFGERASLVNFRELNRRPEPEAR